MYFFIVWPNKITRVKWSNTRKVHVDAFIALRWGLSGSFFFRTYMAQLIRKRHAAHPVVSSFGRIHWNRSPISYG